MAVFTLVESSMDEVERIIRATLGAEESLVSDVADHLLEASGKRLRPALVLLAGQFGPAPGPQLAEVAAAVELIHMASLVHDDIIDRATLRRGLVALHRRFGPEVAVLAGDFLYARAFQIFAAVGDPRIVRGAADVVGVMCAGEIRQHLDQGRLATEGEYLARIEAKTAHFLAESCRLGAFAAMVDEEAAAALAAFGRDVGMAFQIVDDLLDWTAEPERLGKAVGEDIREGVYTLAVIYAREHPAVRDRLLQYLADTDAPVEAIRDLLEECGALSYTRDMAERYVRSAVATLRQELPPGRPRDALEDLAGFVLVRDH